MDFSFRGKCQLCAPELCEGIDHVKVGRRRCGKRPLPVALALLLRRWRAQPATVMIGWLKTTMRRIRREAFVFTVC